MVDTSVWSLFLRRRRVDLSAAERRIVRTTRELVRDGHAVLIGVVRQELLSGIADQNRFEELRAHLQFFDDEPPDVADYEVAAQFDNHCRAVGVATSPADMLVCAMARRRNLWILT